MNVAQSYFPRAEVAPFSVAEFAPQLLLVLGHKSSLEGPTQPLKELESFYPDALVIGSSTGKFMQAGAIHDVGIGVTGIQFDQGNVSSYSIDETDDPGRDGEIIAQQIVMEGKPTGILLFYSLELEKPEALLNSLRKHIDCPITGAVASDHFTFDKTAVYDGSEKCQAVMVVVYEDSTKLSTGTSSGVKGEGCGYMITKSQGATIEEIDGRPALDVYRDHLGDDFLGLPLSATHYPLLTQVSANQKQGLMRYPKKYDFGRKTITLGGLIPESPSQLKMFTYNDSETLLSAGVDAALAAGKGNNSEALNLYFGCSMRHAALGQLSELEYQQALGNLQPGVPSFGFYGYGQICYFQPTRRSELHNLNVTIASFQLA